MSLEMKKGRKMPPLPALQSGPIKPPLLYPFPLVADDVALQAAELHPYQIDLQTGEIPGSQPVLMAEFRLKGRERHIQFIQKRDPLQTSTFHEIKCVQCHTPGNCPPASLRQAGFHGR